MGKRSNFEKVPRSWYPTPFSAVVPLIPHLKDNFFVEPCAGNGVLAQHLERFNKQFYSMSDIHPMDGSVMEMDAFDFSSDYPVLTNPPWDRHILHPMIEHFRNNFAYAWLLIDADWAFTKQAGPYMKYCKKFVAIGRVKWIPDSKMQGKDNCAWYLFQKDPCETIFVGR